MPTPVQAPRSRTCCGARDVLGCAQTGTGKTAAFALPILQRLRDSAPRPRARLHRALVLDAHARARVADRRELRDATAGTGAAPHRDLRRRRPGARRSRRCARGVDILVATPGRLLDLMQPGRRRPRARVEVFVLDEADRMLDMGFIHDVRRVIATLPQQAPDAVLLGDHAAARSQTLAAQHPDRPGARSRSTRSRRPPSRSSRRCYFVEKARQARAARPRCCSDDAIDRALVFTRTKHGANRVAEQLAARRHRGRRRSTATSRRTRASARSRASSSGDDPRAGRDRHRGARHRRRRHHARRSTSTCRTCPRATCTASAAPARAGRRASRCRSAHRTSAATSTRSSAFRACASLPWSCPASSRAARRLGSRNQGLPPSAFATALPSAFATAFAIALSTRRHVRSNAHRALAMPTRAAAALSPEGWTHWLASRSA